MAAGDSIAPGYAAAAAADTLVAKRKAPNWKVGGESKAVGRKAVGGEKGDGGGKDVGKGIGKGKGNKRKAVDDDDDDDADDEDAEDAEMVRSKRVKVEELVMEEGDYA